MCEICKAKDQKLFKTTIHKRNVAPIEIMLCYHHDLELFKRGQEHFLLKYKQELSTVLKGATPIDTQDDFKDLKYT